MKSDKMKERLVVQAAEEDVMESAPLIEESASEREIDLTRAIVLFLIPALGGLLFGYDIGATSGAIDSIKDAVKSGTDWYDLSAFQEGLVVSSALLGGMVGSVFTAALGSKLGRKTELLLASVLYGSGILVSVFAGSCPMLCLGRLTYGVGVGFAMHGAPSYIAETAPSSLRGLFISLKEALIVFGILLGYFVSFLLVDDVGGWRWNYGVALPVILVFGTGMLFLPESPRLLILQKKVDEAKAAMRSVCGDVNDVDAVVESETALMQTVVGDQQKPSEGLFERRNWKPLYITLSLVFFQQATGQPSVLYYAQEIFQKAKIFSDSSSASAAAVVMGFWKLVTTIFSATKVESLGRRPLLLYGVSGLTVSLGVLSVSNWLGDVPSISTAAAWGGVVALLVYVGSYQFSFGPVTWLLVGELYPLETRTQGIALCTFTNFGVNFLVSLLFPVLSDSIGLSAEYLVFALIGAVGVVSIYLSVPETTGKSLEEIEAIMES